MFVFKFLINIILLLFIQSLLLVFLLFYHYYNYFAIIINRSTVAGLLLQLVGHVLCTSGLQVAWKTFGKAFSTACSGPPLGRPAWLCPGPAKMEKKIAAKMLLTSVEIGSKTLPGGSKIAPKWLLEGLWVPWASWDLLGALGTLMGRPGSLLGSPGVPWSPPGEARGLPKISLGGLGTPQERKVYRFYFWRVPGKVPEGLWEVILGTFLRLGWREQQKAKKVPNTDF